MREWGKRKDLQQPSIIVGDQSPEAVHSRRRLPTWPSGQLKVAFVNEFVSGHKYPSYSPSGQTFRTTIIQEKQILPQPLSLIAPQALSVHAPRHERRAPASAGRSVGAVQRCRHQGGSAGSLLT